MRLRGPRRALPGVLLGLALLAGCASEGQTSTDPAAALSPSGSDAEPKKYVALGDSFTAAPYVPDTEIAGGCFRSSGNYPRLVADELGADLTDVSCSGADTRDLLFGQSFHFTDESLPPQVEALDDETELVTMTIGGNDGDLFATLVGECTRVADADTSCEDLVSTRIGEIDQMRDLLTGGIAEALRKVQKAAPRARVVLVGYLRMAAESPCGRMPMREDDLDYLSRIERTLRDAQEAAAERAGVEFLDMYAASRGHEVCSPEPWVNGVRTDQQRALAFHPFAEGQQAVAEQLLELLS